MLGYRLAFLFNNFWDSWVYNLLLPSQICFYAKQFDWFTHETWIIYFVCLSCTLKSCFYINAENVYPVSHVLHLEENLKFYISVDWDPFVLEAESKIIFFPMKLKNKILKGFFIFKDISHYIILIQKTLHFEFCTYILSFFK